jgi:RHS repeat-associated protein
MIVRNVGAYRYGFQGQEMDDEIKGEGNSVNYKYRMHDPRVGRFFAVDPLASNYPHNSPYAFSENVVINAIELEGLELFFVNGYRGYYAGESSEQDMISYWDVESDFVGTVSNYFNQTDIRYADGHLHDDKGSPFSSPKHRMANGFIEMTEMLENGGLVLDNNEPVTFVGHSQGNAHSIGMMIAIMVFQDKYNANLNEGEAKLDVDINFVALSVFQGDEFTVNTDLINAIQFTYDNDLYKNRPMKGVTDANSEERSNLDEQRQETGRLETHSAPIEKKEAFEEIKNEDASGIFKRKEKR